MVTDSSARVTLIGPGRTPLEVERHRHGRRRQRNQEQDRKKGASHGDTIPRWLRAVKPCRIAAASRSAGLEARPAAAGSPQGLRYFKESHEFGSAPGGYCSRSRTLPVTHSLALDAKYSAA